MSNVSRMCIVIPMYLTLLQAAVISPVQLQEDLYETTTRMKWLANEGASTASTIMESELSTLQNSEKNTTDPSSPKSSAATVGGNLNINQFSFKTMSAKLLLLSTPSKRPVEVEQQLEELDENGTAETGSGEGGLATTTENSVQQQDLGTTAEFIEATIKTIVETTTTASESSDRKTTKLCAINPSKSLTVPNEAAATITNNATTSIAEHSHASTVNSVDIELALVDPQTEYVLLDEGLGRVTSPMSDERQLGSFTHIDSDVLLQPVVHSIEIVPTRLDDPLIVNYVHNLR